MYNAAHESSVNTNEHYYFEINISNDIFRLIFYNFKVHLNYI